MVPLPAHTPPSQKRCVRLCVCVCVRVHVRVCVRVSVRAKLFVSPSFACVRVFLRVRVCPCTFLPLCVNDVACALLS